MKKKVALLLFCLSLLLQPVQAMEGNRDFGRLFRGPTGPIAFITLMPAALLTVALTWNLLMKCYRGFYIDNWYESEGVELTTLFFKKDNQKIKDYYDKNESKLNDRTVWTHHYTPVDNIRCTPLCLAEITKNNELQKWLIDKGAKKLDHEKGELFYHNLYGKGL